MAGAVSEFVFPSSVLTELFLHRWETKYGTGFWKLAGHVMTKLFRWR